MDAAESRRPTSAAQTSCLNHMAHHLSQRSDRWKHDVGFSRVAPVPLEELSDEGKAILG